MDRTGHHAATLLFAASLAATAVVDWRRRRIPNGLVAALLAGGLAVSVARGGGAGAVSAIEGVAAGGALLAAPYLLGVLGAGDVKLLAAAGAWLGPIGAVWALGFGMVAGGALTLLAYLRSSAATRGAIRENLVSLVLARRVPKPADVGGRAAAESVPFGVAVAAGSFGAWLLTAAGP